MHAPFVMATEPTAGDEFLTRHLPELRATAAKLSGSPDRAEDLVQEALAAAIAALGRLRQRESIGAWLQQILRRRWYDVLRRRGAEQRALAQTPPSKRETRETVDPELVRRALKTLAAEERRVLELRFFQSMNATEIGTMLGRPAGTIRCILFHALRNFETAYCTECRTWNA